jgi:hypothetical protein
MTIRHTGRLILGEHAYRRYCLDIEPGVTLSDLLKPEIWCRNTDGQLRPNDVVRVRSDTQNFDCELIVKAILPGAGVVMQLDTSKVIGSAEHTRLKAMADAAEAEQQAARQAEIDAAIAGGRP